MANFIRLGYHGDARIINLDAIVSIRDIQGPTRYLNGKEEYIPAILVTFTKEAFEVMFQGVDTQLRESYTELYVGISFDEIKELICVNK